MSDGPFDLDPIEVHHMSEHQAIRPPPPPWRERRATIRRRWAVPFQFTEWLCEWAVCGLSRWKFLDLLNYAGRLSILVAVIYYFVEAPDRMKQKHYQAWQVINTAQGKGGNGGRIEALQELNADHVPLVGVDVSDAFLQGLRLPGADLRRGNFRGADLLAADLARANLEDVDMTSANLRRANLRGANLRGAKLNAADLHDADLSGADLTDADLRDADLEGAAMSGSTGLPKTGTAPPLRAPHS